MNKDPTISKISASFLDDESLSPKIVVLKQFWDHETTHRPELKGLKLEFEAFYRDQQRLQELQKEDPEICGLFLEELKQKYRIGPEAFDLAKQRQNFSLALLIILLQDIPLTKASILTAFLLDKIERDDVMASFERAPSMDKPIGELDTIDIKHSNLSFIRNWNKENINQYKSLLLTKQKYFESLNLKNTYTKEDYEFLKLLNTPDNSEINNLMESKSYLNIENQDSAAELIKLNCSTPEQQKKIIELIYNSLNGKCFNISYPQFERHFIKNEKVEFSKIVWIKDVAEIKGLIDWLLDKEFINNKHNIKLIQNHFYLNTEGNVFNGGTLKSLGNAKATYDTIKGILDGEHIFKSLFKELLEFKKAMQTIADQQSKP